MRTVIAIMSLILPSLATAEDREIVSDMQTKFEADSWTVKGSKIVLIKYGCSGPGF